MLGGGFMGQMHQTNKQNREMLGKEKRKPFDKKNTSEKRTTDGSLEDIPFSEQERLSILEKLKTQEAEERRKKVLILIVSLVITVALFAFLFLRYADSIKEVLQ
jgi:hypothetical protein